MYDCDQKLDRGNGTGRRLSIVFANSNQKLGGWKAWEHRLVVDLWIHTIEPVIRVFAWCVCMRVCVCVRVCDT